VLAPKKGEQRLNGIAISWGGCDVPDASYACDSRVGKMPLNLFRGATHDVADPKPRLEAALPIEAMYARVFSTALQEDVITVPGPGCREGRVNNGAAVALTLKFWMRDQVFEKAVPPSSS